MTYDQQCETLRFVWRNESFRFRCFWPRDVRNETARSCGSPQAASDRDFAALGRLANLEGCSRRFAALQNESSDRSEGAKNLRKRALKPLKQLARVNLCATPREPRSTATIGSEADDSR
jgi:hypothetical protein